MKAALPQTVSLALLLVAGVATFAHGQSVRGVLGNGGASASNGAIVLQGTVGQPVVGLSIGGGVQLGHGFWSYSAAPALGVSGPPGARARIALGPASPSPARGTVRFAMTLPNAGLVELAVFDAAGRRVGGSSSRSLAAGSYRLDWSSPESGPGVYFARFAVDGKFVGARRLVLTK